VKNYLDSAKAFCAFLAVRRGREAPFCLSEPLFIKEDGCALDRELFITSLKHILDIYGYNSKISGRIEILQNRKFATPKKSKKGHGTLIF
jgi:hypothetical protein